MMKYKFCKQSQLKVFMKIFNHINTLKSSKILYYWHFHGLLCGNFTFQKNSILKYSDKCCLKFTLFHMFSCASFPEFRCLVNFRHAVQISVHFNNTIVQCIPWHLLIPTGGFSVTGVIPFSLEEVLLCNVTFCQRKTCDGMIIRQSLTLQCSCSLLCIDMFFFLFSFFILLQQPVCS